MEYQDQLDAFVGRVINDEKWAADPVNMPMIRHWVEAMELESPIHLDEEAARAAGRPGAVAPASMTQAWVMRGYAATQYPSAEAGAFGELVDLLAEGGYTSVVATDSDFEFHRDLVVGDLISVDEVVEEIGPEKQTGLGTGRFITTVKTYRDTAGETVATQRWRTYRFAPAARSSAETTSASVEQRPPAVAPPENVAWRAALASQAGRTRSVASLSVGQELDPLSIAITRTVIVATAIASRDYQDVHHDPALAAERGSPDIFMNILTSNALTERYVASWMGPGAVVKRINIRLGAPNYPGDTMTYTGSVRAMEGDLVEVDVLGANRLGAHVKGTVTVQLPAVAT